jgi:hypothetical protein
LSNVFTPHTLELDQFGKKHESLAHQLYPLLVFSMFELVARTLLKFVNESCTDWHSEANMPPEWIEASRLTEFRIKDTGEIKVDEPRVRTIDLLIFALKYAARALHGESFAPKSLPSWPKVLAAIKIRDDVMHPNSVDSLTVTQAEIDVCNEAVGWLLKCLSIIKTSPTKR